MREKILTETSLTILNVALRFLTPPIINTLRDKWNEESAYRYAKDKLRLKFESRLEFIEYDEICSIIKIKKDDFFNIPMNDECFNLVSFLKEISKQKILDNIYDKNEFLFSTFVEQFVEKTLEFYLTQKITIEDKIIIDLLYQILDKQFIPTQYIVPLHELLSQPDFSTFRLYLENNLFYFLKEDFDVMNGIKNLILKYEVIQKPILITGPPETGKTSISIFLAYELLKKQYCTYYIRLDRTFLDYTRLVDELLNVSRESHFSKSIVVFDNCHDRINIFNDLSATYSRFKNLIFLFISRDLPESDFNIDMYSDFNLIEFFNHRHFLILNSNFSTKAKGIINNFKKYLEVKDEQTYEIGKIHFVINNAHQSLIALNYNLRLWRSDFPLEQVDKNEVFKQLYSRYLNNDEISFILIIASLFKYEIYLEASEKFIQTALKLSKSGLITKEEYSNYYYLHHSSFAKLLLNAYRIHHDFTKFRDMDDLVYNKIREYILSFDIYPSNCDSIFYYLNSNHGLDIARDLLKDEEIISRFLDFNNRNLMNVELYLFFIYRLSRKDTKIAERLCDEISNDVWKRNLLEMSFHRLSLSLFHLDQINPDKATSILNSFKIDDLIKKILSSNLKLHLITNAIREVVRISGRSDLGIKLLNLLSIEYLINKIKSTNLVHLGKTISELHATSPTIAEKVLINLEPSFLSRLIKDSDLKSYSKSLNEIKKVHPQLSIILLTKTPDEVFISRLINKDLRLEGISRSLTELSKIDSQKAKNLFSKLPTDKLLELIHDSSIIQIAQSFSEFLSIDKKDKNHKYDLCGLFSKTDDLRLIQKISHGSSKFHTIGDALSLLSIFDYFGKITLILSKIDKINLLSKATKCTFHEFCLGINSIHFSNNDLSKYILDNYNEELLIRRANTENLEVIGSDLNKLSKIDKTICDKLLKEVNWQKIIKRDKNIKFTKLVDSITALSNYDKYFAQNLLDIIQQLFGPMFLVKRASYENKNALADSLNKLNTVDRKIARHIGIELKKTGQI